MADHAKAWPAFVSTALRNELRDPGENSPVQANYGWQDWYPNVVAAADAINAANPSPLIFFSGLNFDTDLRNVTRGIDLGGGQVFDINSFPYSNKIVFELHNYNNNYEGSCADFGSGLYNNGYDAMDTSSNTTARNIAPVVMTEFGFPQDDSTYQNPYPNCIKEYLTSIRGGWIQWVISGSYYIRQGIQDYEETWGMLNHDWSDWRSPAAIDDFTKPFIEATLT
ncbi:hypothetical protein PRZ48_009181 [Zasmidium cellare]|uniref:Glycoside hydrolase family 5 domain-containing protein n=1 Tax=Zasmidium cellare TaxID=395010 RepID=A0ABR0EBN2_ZASCE|nr:hypothetical protein PRZ48_009181 [Zasmidium cellare]